MDSGKDKRENAQDGQGDRDRGGSSSRHHHSRRDRDTEESRQWNRDGDRGFRRGVDGGWNQRSGYNQNHSHSYRYDDSGKKQFSHNPRRQNRDRDYDDGDRSQDRKAEGRSRSPAGEHSRETSDSRRSQDSLHRSGDRPRTSYGRNRGNERPLSKSAVSSAASSKVTSSAQGDAGKRADDDIDEEDLKPVSLNITCPAASTLVKQIEARKMLFSKKDKPVEAATPTTSVWQQTTFSDDSDGKVSAKFKRLMGIKNQEAPPPQAPKSPPGTHSKEFFVNLEKQYEVARTITHTQRGMGLGFSSGGGSSALLKPPPGNSHTYFK